MSPQQVVDVLALMGDSIDNVKGVPGIGEKGARDLIATYGSLDALLARADEMKQKKYREGLKTYADQARQSRELVTIHTDVDVPFDTERFRFRGATASAATRCSRRWGSARWCPSSRRRRHRWYKDYGIVGLARGAGGAGGGDPQAPRLA